MKTKLLSILFLVVFTISSYSQNTYKKLIKELVENRIEEYPSEGKNTTHIKNILNAFNHVNKPIEEDYTKRTFGVALALTEEDMASNQKYNDPLIYPALYSFHDSKIDIAALRTSGGKVADPSTIEYNQTYLYDYEKTGSTKLFYELITSKRNALGTYTENTTEIVVKEPSSLSFIRSDNDWMYIISIDKNYKSLAIPRILIYAFKKNFTGRNIFVPSN